MFTGHGTHRFGRAPKMSEPHDLLEDHSSLAALRSVVPSKNGEMLKQ
jgi:hypothetical protein